MAKHLDNFMTQREYIEKVLRPAIDQEPTVLAWADRHGISNPYLYNVLRGKQAPGKKILDATGHERISSIRKKR